MRTSYLSVIMLAPSLMAAAPEYTLIYTDDNKELRSPEGFVEFTPG
jgi:hypothetical protein